MHGSQKQRVVLVGAGNANLQVLRRWVSSPWPDTELVLITDSLRVPYSGMVPGWVNGTYKEEQCLIDVVPLCGRGGVILIEATAKGLDRVRQDVVLDDRRVAYDWVAINVGSEPTVASGPDPEYNFRAKPLTQLIDEVQRLDRVLEGGAPFHLGVVGSGAGGCELALALKKRHRSHPHFSLTLFDSHPHPLPGFSRRASRIFEKALHRAGVCFSPGHRVVGKNAQGVELDHGQSVSCDGVLWVTRGQPNGFTAGLDLARDEKGFIRVHPQLVSVDDPRVFATGDAVSFPGGLPKAGVYAVRQGPVLWENLRRAVLDRPLRRYRPQSRFLTLLNLSDGRAVANYGSLSVPGVWAWKWKDWIDQKWMRQLTDLSGMGAMDPMRCGGCGAKVAALDLDRVLEEATPPPTPEVIAGLKEREDGAVVKIGDATVVESVDFFRGLPLDPFVLGQIAALHALSDLWAMGASPKAAQAIVVLREGQHRTLAEVLGGMQKGLQGSGAVLVGGHTSEGAEFSLGMAVTGDGGGGLFRKGALKEGDGLVLTQALGSGALLAAYPQGKLLAQHWEPLLEGLLRSNAAAAECFHRFGVVAATDVTGFGLGGHLMEMLLASGLSAQLHVPSLPTLPGFYLMTEAGVESTLAPSNQENIRGRVVGHPPGPALSDPQTSGGLLAGVAWEKGPALVQALVDAGYPDAVVVGKVTAASPTVLDLTTESF